MKRDLVDLLIQSSERFITSARLTAWEPVSQYVDCRELRTWLELDIPTRCTAIFGFLKFS